MPACGSGRIRIRAPESPADDARCAKRATSAPTSGIVDVSTLGKIELQGRDVAELLNRIYINRWDTLSVGRCRYGVMLRDDGIVLDDGTTSRLAPSHYLMTTTTVNAAENSPVPESLLQTEWPELDVFVTSVTEQWAGRQRWPARQRARCWRASSTSMCRTRRFRFSPWARAVCARRWDRCPRASSG
jgi:hypothetical protein